MNRRRDRAKIAVQFLEGARANRCKILSHSNLSDPTNYFFFRILLFLAGILAVIFSLLVLSSCDFIEFAATNATDPNELEGAVLIEFSFGMFRYDANDTGCRSFDDNDILVDWPIWTGRGSTAVALLCAAAACLLMLVEFVCCRFKFSRCLMTTLFSFAIFGMALAFIMFASDVWYVLLHRNGNVS